MKVCEFLSEGVNQNAPTYSVNALRVGYMRGSHRSSARDKIKEVLANEANIEIGKDVWAADGKVLATKLEKGMTVLASYNGTNQGIEVCEILGVTKDGHGEGKVDFDSVKDAFKAYGVTKLDDLDKAATKAGDKIHLVVRILDDGDEGPFFYVYQGAWARGSGAEKLSFTKIKKI